MAFTVEIKGIKNPNNCEVEIYLDRQAIDDLVKQFSFLQKKGDHAHFFTPAWGDGTLTDVKQFEANTLVNHVRVTLV